MKVKGGKERGRGREEAVVSFERVGVWAVTYGSTAKTSRFPLPA